MVTMRTLSTNMKARAPTRHFTALPRTSAPTPTRYFFPNCLYLEVYRSKSADIVIEPACRYPIASESLDGIGCFAVLEHVQRPWEAARDFYRMLKPGGRVYIDWPFLQPVHGYPSHYYNATREGLRAMFDGGFEVEHLETLNNQTPDHTLSWIIRSLNEALAGTEIGDRLTNMRIGDLVSEPAGSPFWREIVDSLPAKTIETLACGNTLIARKR
jgi:SAM-dependent methyltransferase